ncbi:MAG: hypothetical protein GPJ54_20675 [Candidatus Heimdallarchaeota archaeon]|nr:hypothetical protein [Candidatus Heimdallarchaeota archaeon]
MTIPLTVVTWRLGKIGVDIVESLHLHDEFETIMSQMRQEFGSAFYLNTCQRIVIVTSHIDSSNENNIQNFYLRLKKIQNDNELYNGEIFTGLHALEHLALLVSSLDSVVIGEDQILHQFKQAFDASQLYLDSNLQFILQKIIKIGKRVRRESLLKYGRTSTFVLIEQKFETELKTASSIGLIGTGSMAKYILNNLKKINPNISVYSRKKVRIGVNFEGYEVLDYNSFKNHSIIITATSAVMPIITVPFIKKLDVENILIFDLGMPRNCVEDIGRLNNVELVDMENLLSYSNEGEEGSKSELQGVYEVINDELRKLMKKLNKKKQSKKVVSLRMDLMSLAEAKKSELIDKEENILKFNQFVNQLIHISQKHLEQAILEE